MIIKIGIIILLISILRNFYIDALNERKNSGV